MLTRFHSAFPLRDCPPTGTGGHSTSETKRKTKVKTGILPSSHVGSSGPFILSPAPGKLAFSLSLGAGDREAHGHTSAAAPGSAAEDRREAAHSASRDPRAVAAALGLSWAFPFYRSFRKRVVGTM